MTKFDLMKNTLRRKNIFTVSIYAIPFSVFYYLIYGRIFLTSQGPIHGTDFEVPINPLFYFWNIAFPWNPLGMGSRALPNAADLTMGIVGTLSMGNALVSEILLLSIHPVVAYAGMLLVTRRILGASIIASVFASLLYAFSPPYLAWFTLPYQFGVAFVPLLFYVFMKSVNHINNQSSLKKTAAYSLVIACVIGLISSLYFHILYLLFGFALLISIFVFSPKSSDKRRNLTRIGFLTLFTLLLIPLTSPRLIENAATLSSSPETLSTVMRGTSNQYIETMKTFYKDASVRNIMNLSGGTPNDERFLFLNDNFIGVFLPILSFAGLLFITRKGFARQSYYLYLSSVMSIVALIALALFVRNSAFAEQDYLSNPLLAGLRRPERILETLSFFYAICIAFTITSAEKSLSARLQTLTCFRMERLQKAGVFLVSFLILTSSTAAYIAYSGLSLDLSHPAYTQLYKSRPQGFDQLQKVLESKELQTNDFDSDYRYMVLPFYVPVASYLRYNYPNFFYFGSYSNEEVIHLGDATTDLVAKKDESAIVPLSLSSVKNIVVLPSNFQQDELQAWRLNGDTRKSGPHLFGDIARYDEFMANLPGMEKHSYDNITVYYNEKALKKTYVSEVLATAHGDIEKVFSLLKSSDHFDAPTYVMKYYDDGTSPNIVYYDFSTMRRTEIMSYDTDNLGNQADKLVSKIKSAKNNYEISDKSIIVWGNDVIIKPMGDYLDITADIPPEKGYLSIWINLDDKSSQNNIFVTDIAVEDLSGTVLFDVLDRDHKSLRSSTAPIIRSIGNETRITATVFTDIRSVAAPNVLKILVPGMHDSAIHVKLHKSLTLPEPFSYSSDSSNWETAKYIMDADRNIVSSYFEGFPSSSDYSDAFKDDNLMNFTGWKLSSETNTWKSPTELVIEAGIQLLENTNETKEVLVPVFFGSAYDKSWQLNVRTSSGSVSNVEHAVGNSYGNLWLVDIRGIDTSVKELNLNFVVQWDPINLLLYRSYTFASVGCFPLAGVLYYRYLRKNTSESNYLPEIESVPHNENGSDIRITMPKLVGKTTQTSFTFNASD